MTFRSKEVFAVAGVALAGMMVLLVLMGSGGIKPSAGGFNMTDNASILLYENFGGNQTLGSVANTFSQTALNHSAGTSALAVPAFQTVDVNHPVVLRMGTGVVSGDDLIMTFLPQTSGAAGTGVGSLSTAINWEFVTVVRLPVITTMGMKACMLIASQTQQTSTVVNNGACIRFDTSVPDTTWKFFTCASSVCTTVDSTVTVTAGTFYLLRIYSTLSGTWSADVTPAGGSKTTVTSSTHIPSSLLAPTLTLINRSVSGTNMDVAAPLYFDMTGLVRP